MILSVYFKIKRWQIFIFEKRAESNQYTSDIKFGIEFLSIELPQLRTITVSKTIPKPLDFWAQTFKPK